MTALPMGWWLARLEQVLQPQSNKRLLQQGWSPRCEARPSRDASVWGVLKTTAIQPGWFDETQNKELPAALAPRAAIEVQPGDMLMTCAGPRSRCGVPTLVRRTRPRLMLSGKMYRFRPTDEIDARFLELFLLSPDAQARVDAMKTGISDSGLNLTQDRFLQLPVVVPPLHEQRRIVDILEDYLSRLKAAQAACSNASGRLVALRESWLLQQMGDPPRREVHRLGDCLVESRGGWSRSQKHLVAASHGVPYLKMNNVSRNGTLVLDDVVYVEADAGAIDRFGILAGDVLFNSKNSGDLIGKTAVATEAIEGWTFNENIMRLRFDKRFEPAFVGLWFLGPIMRRNIIQAASASTNVAAVYRHHLVEMPLWLPETVTQNRLVDGFGQIAGAADHLQSEIRAAARRAAGLRRALLSVAFSGRLSGRSSDWQMVEEMAGV